MVQFKSFIKLSTVSIGYHLENTGVDAYAQKKTSVLYVCIEAQFNIHMLWCQATPKKM